jgi:hypothetical protein
MNKAKSNKGRGNRAYQIFDLLKPYTVENSWIPTGKIFVLFGQQFIVYQSVFFNIIRKG